MLTASKMDMVKGVKFRRTQISATTLHGELVSMMDLQDTSFDRLRTALGTNQCMNGAAWHTKLQ